MKRLITSALSLLLFGQASASYAAAQPDPSRKIIVTRTGQQPSSQGPQEFFTGFVRVDPLFRASPSDTSAAYVTFEAGARSAWHTHPLGQILVVTAGTGQIQRWGDPIQEMRPGDVVSIPPGEKHWHGASPGGAMTHIAITGAVGGKNVDWMEKVTEEQYTMAAAQQTHAGAVRTAGDVAMVSPALDRYTQTTLADLWKRPGLSPRDRSLVTLAVLIARNQASELPTYLNRALDSGVKPGEVSEVITHLAFYSGWANGLSAVAAAKELFGARRIGADQLPSATGPRLPMDQASEQRRATFVEQSVGPVAPGVVQYTTDPLFHDLWLRPALAPRDRSLVTVSALVASGQSGQLAAHLNRALDNGLTQAEASEALTHLLFYAGWPNVFTAVPIAKDVFDKRRE
jgi:4-carboxymuconolactone decarboxylase